MKPILRLATLVCSLSLASLVNASPVTIGDPSFEGNSIAAGGYTYDLSPEWTGTSGSNNSNAFEEYITGFAATGTDHLGIQINYDVWQDLGVTYQANTRYTLTVACGNRSGNTQATNQSQYLLADSTGVVRATGSYNASAVTAGTFADAPALVFDTPTDSDSVGKTVRILLRARGAGRSHFDNIRLDATSLAPAGSATVVNLDASAITSTTATLNGQITAIGDAAPVVTIFWGTTPGGSTPANWENSVTLPGTQSGTFSAAVTGLSANTTYYFQARATNSAGESWAPVVESLETLPLPATVSTGSASQVGSTTATLGATVTDTGGEAPSVTLYYGSTDGGSVPANWAGSVSLGVLSASGTASVSGLSSSTAYYFRAFAQNSGGGAWASNTASFTTQTVVPAQVINDTATGITGTTATLRGQITDTGNAAPTITIFYGTSDGGTTPGSWTSSALVGTDSGSFTRFVSGLTASTTYFFRCRAVNSAGTSWAPTTATFTTTALVSSVPVINEIHYHPDDDPTLGPIPLEFIELYNPGDASVDLSNWKLANAVTFTIPSGTTLAPGGYVVIAQDPATLLSKYAATALGPWVGKLSNSGETIELRDAGNVLKDSVSYQPGFPWPTSADGAGPSIELIHASLDNDLGGSWRSSGSVGTTAVTYISPSATGWKYKKGTAEASSPVEDWRNLAYVDSTWSTGQTPIGYGTTVTCNTTLSDMKGTGASNYSTVYARKSFTIPSGQVRDLLTLKVRLDDGGIVWINGTEVYRSGVASGQLAYNALATVNVATAGWTTVNLTGASAYLFGGTNVITIQGINQTTNSSDFNLDAELSSPATGASTLPTPGAANASRIALNLTPPQARQISHSPSQPTSNVPVTVTARVTDPDGMGAVTLAYQVVDPGSYIRKTDATYLTSWTNVTMLDNGTGGDLVAGDSIYTAVLPASLQVHRRLIRYKVTSADSLGNSQTVPYADDEQPNFAYFVYDGVPAWSGAIRTGAPVVTYPPATLNSLQTYHLIANATDVNNSQYVSGSNGVRFRGTIIYDGNVYDHIEFKNRGIGSTYVSGKNKWNIFFNRSRDLAARDNWGRKYAQTWNNLILNANASPWAPINRGSGGIEEAASARIMELAGNTNFRTNYIQFRVIDDAVETSPTDQYTGDLWGLYLAIEPTEGNFLDERGLSDGNVYAIEGNGGDKKHQGDGQSVDSSDWNTFRNALATSGQTEAWYRANMDLDKLYTFVALNRLIGNVDVRPGDNYRYYHRSTDNKWEILGYDFDMNFIAAHHWGGSMDGVTVAGQPNSIMAIMRWPNLAREYRNRCRELIDLLASDGSANGGQIGQLFAEYAAMIHPTGQTATWANLDAAMWNLNPKSTGSHKGYFFKASMTDSRGGLGGTVSTGSWIRTLADPDGDGYSDFPARVQWFVDYATNTYPTGTAPWVRKATNTAGGGTDSDVNRQKGYGYKYLEWESLYGGYANANVEPTTPANTDYPNTPVLLPAGNPAFPTSDLKFSPSAFSDPQGAGTFSAWQWRLAEISAPGIPGYDSTKPCKYEIENPVTSPELTTAPGTFSIPLGVAQVGKTYRVRIRQKDTTGNWSHWSSPVQFAATTPPAQTLVHYWNFNSFSNNAVQINPTQTTGGGVINIALTSGAATQSDSGQSFAASNARNGDGASNHLRLNNPLGATVTASLPTTGYQNPIVRYETRRSTQGAATQTISYTVNGSTFLPFTTLTSVDGAPVLQTLDMRSITEAYNNPLFAIRITFQQGAGGTGGNDRIDNLTLEGDVLPATQTLFSQWRTRHFSNIADRSNDAISGPNAATAGDGVPNLIRYALGVGPTGNVTPLLPKLVTAGATRRFKFPYDPSKTDIAWVVRASPNLSSWPSVLFDSRTSPIPALESGWLPVNLPPYLGAGTDTDPRMFTRLEIVPIGN